MEHASDLVIPRTFEEFGEYLVVEPAKRGQQQVFTRVKFYAYDPCPAFVIVRTQMGIRWRCPRDELFSSAAQRIG